MVTLYVYFTDVNPRFNLRTLRLVKPYNKLLTYDASSIQFTVLNKETLYFWISTLVMRKMKINLFQYSDLFLNKM